mgnify:CR=1 FL=1
MHLKEIEQSNKECIQNWYFTNNNGTFEIGNMLYSPFNILGRCLKMPYFNRFSKKSNTCVHGFLKHSLNINEIIPWENINIPIFYISCFLLNYKLQNRIACKFNCIGQICAKYENSTTLKKILLC